MRILLLLGFALTQLAPVAAQTPQLVVAAQRNFQAEGASGIHLYLYDGTGAMKRQLTNDPHFEDRDPAFSPDGKAVYFSRSSNEPARQAEAGRYSVSLEGGKATRILGAIEVHSTLQSINFSDLLSFPDEGGGALHNVSSSDHTKTLIQHGANWPYTYLLAVGSDEPKPLSTFAGYQSSDDGDEFLAVGGDPFLTGPGGYNVLFMLRHPDNLWVCDTVGRKFYEINPDSSAENIYAAESLAGFYLIHCGLQPLGSTGKTVWCGALEFWDEHFQKIVFGQPLSVCYGAAAFYGPRQTFHFLDPKRGS